MMMTIIMMIIIVVRNFTYIYIIIIIIFSVVYLKIELKCLCRADLKHACSEKRDSPRSAPTK